MKTPVAFFVFNRPDTTQVVFNRIAAARPERLLIVADGPRRDHPDDRGLCAEVRRIVSEVDWPCRVDRDLSDVNLGCGRRVSSGLEMVFEKCEEAIVLEDDCVPTPSFFPFCEELLARYRDDERVGAISGCNLGADDDSAAADYAFSRYAIIWGWATWRRVFRRYDFRLRDFDPAVFDRIEDAVVRRHALDRTDRARKGTLDTWDFQLVYGLLAASQLGVVPSRNLVANIGLARTDATHTTYDLPESVLRAREVAFPLRHPAAVERSARADAIVEDVVRARVAAAGR